METIKLVEHLEKQVCLIENSLNEHINKVKHIEYIYIRNISDMNVLNNEYNELKKIIVQQNIKINILLAHVPKLDTKGIQENEILKIKNI